MFHSKCFSGYGSMSTDDEAPRGGGFNRGRGGGFGGRGGGFGGRGGSSGTY